MARSKNAGPGGPAEHQETASANGQPPLPEGEAGEVLRVATKAAIAVLGDQRVWDEEAAREGAPRLAWLKGSMPRSYAGLLMTFGKVIAMHCVEKVNHTHGKGTVPNEIGSAQFQLVLRVTARAVYAIDRALNDHFGSGNRLSIVRDWGNWIRECDAIAAMRLPTRALRSAALKAAGISKAAASRARTRGLKRSTFR
jgi:hypothetical protein